MTTNSSLPNKPIEPNHGAVLLAMCNQYMHQNTMMWNVLFRSITLQLAILAGAYTFKGTYFSPVVLIAGSTLIFLLTNLAYKYQVDRDYNLKFIDNLSLTLISQDIKDIVNVLPIRNENPGKNLIFPSSLDVKGWRFLRSGKFILAVGFGEFFLINIAVAICLLFNPTIFDTAK